MAKVDSPNKVEVTTGMEDALKLLIDELKFLREERERNRNEQGKRGEDEGEKLKLEGERATTRFLFQLKNLVKLKSYEKDEKSSRGILEINKIAFGLVSGKGKLYENSWEIVKTAVKELENAINKAKLTQISAKLVEEATIVKKGLDSCVKFDTKEFILHKGGRQFNAKGDVKIKLDNLSFLNNLIDIDHVVKTVEEKTTGKNWKEEFKAVVLQLNKRGQGPLSPNANPNPPPVVAPSVTSPMTVEGPTNTKRTRVEMSSSQPTLFHLGRQRAESVGSVEFDGLERCVLCKWSGSDKRKLNGHIQSLHQITKPSKVVSNPFKFLPWQGLKSTGEWECPYCAIGKGDNSQSYIAHMAGIHTISQEIIKPFLAGSSTTEQNVEGDNGQSAN